MTQAIQTTPQTTAKTASYKPKFSVRALFREAMILNEAFAELQRLRRLDAAALEDMGLPASAQEETSLSEIAARIRARRSA